MISEKRQEIERKAEEYLGRYNDLLNVNKINSILES